MSNDKIIEALRKVAEWDAYVGPYEGLDQEVSRAVTEALAQAPAPEAREVLTPERIVKIATECGNGAVLSISDGEALTFARAVERAHGVATQRSAGMTEKRHPVVPEGWTIAKMPGEPGIRVVSPIDGPGFLEVHADRGSHSKRMLHALAAALLACPGAPSSEEQRDAARLDWLEARGITTIGKSDEAGCAVVITSLQGPDSIVSHHASLRTAIDAAMAASTSAAKEG